MQIPIYYFTVEGISSSVFESQVYAYISTLRSQGIPAKLIIGQRYKARASIKKLFQLSREDNTQFMFLPQQLDYAKKANRLANRLPNNRKIILHCRNIEAAYIGLLARQKNKNIKLLYDVRGYVEDELRYFKDFNRLEKFEKMHKALFKEPLYYNFVSDKLREVYEDNYHVKFKNYSICVSAYNDKIFKFNPSYTIKSSSKPKVVFVGGSQSYQKIEDLVSMIEKQGTMDFTVITNKKITIQNSKNTKFLYGLKPTEVAQALDGVDYGILYRSSEAFNEVATPTKIAEYWGKGLKVIAINSAGAYTSVIKENPFLGYVYENEKEYLDQSLPEINKEESQKIADFAESKFSLSSNYMKYMLLYNSLLTKENA